MIRSNDAQVHYRETGSSEQTEALETEESEALHGNQRWASALDSTDSSTVMGPPESSAPP